MRVSDEPAIRTQLNERARAFYNKDAEAAVLHYAEDIVNFDLRSHLRRAAARRRTQRFGRGGSIRGTGRSLSPSSIEKPRIA